MKSGRGVMEFGRVTIIRQSHTGRHRAVTGDFSTLTLGARGLVMNFARGARSCHPGTINFRGKTMNSRRMTGSFSAVASDFYRGIMDFFAGAINF
jgi:hypothetical protein